MPDGILADSFGRRVRTLRVSLTDHCNFRCVYCMPPEGLDYLDKSNYLNADAIVRIVRVASDMGVTRCRVTGGEPLLRPDVVEIVRALKSITGLREVSMTTNGSLLKRLAGPLRDAGLDRLNISLDSLDPSRFEAVTRVAQYDRVHDGIIAAADAGFPIKINVVAINGMADDEILAFVDMAAARDIEVRFLEFMPLCGSGWEADRVLPIARVRDTVMKHHRLRELPRGDRPAQLFEIVDGRGRVGFIASLSEPFCGACSRIRLTADGRIRPCLFSNYEHSLVEALASSDDTRLAEAIRHAVLNKPWGSEFSDRPFAEGEDARRQTVGSPLIRGLGG